MSKDKGIKVLLVTRCGCERQLVIPELVLVLDIPMRTARSSYPTDFRKVLETRTFDWHHSDDRGAFFYERGCF